MILFYRRKKKGDISQIIHGNMVFSAYLVKVVFLFPTNMISPFCQKTKNDLLLKNTLKNDSISIFIAKNDIHPKKHGISSDRKIDEKV